MEDKKAVVGQMGWFYVTVVARKDHGRNANLAKTSVGLSSKIRV